VREQVVTFTGLDTEQSKVARDPSLLTVDQNLQHDQLGVLRVRGGCTKASGQTALALPVRAVAGFDPGSGSFVEARATHGATAGVIASGATTLYSALSQNKRPRACVHGRRLYVADGWRELQRWDGIAATTVAAGIVGPDQTPSSWTPAPTTAAGLLTTGSHKFRYRYLDSSTGYVSEPSCEYVAVVTGSGAAQLTFAINTSGAGNIIRSLDAKVDRIVVEATLTGGAVFFKAAEGLQTASTIVVSIADVTLATQSLPWPGTRAENIGTHLPPPIASIVLSFRGRLWLAGQRVHAEGTVAVNNASATITGTGSDWSAALAKPTAASFSNRVTRLFQVAGDAVAYEINTRASTTSAALTAAYGGSNNATAAYKIFTRDRSVFYSEPGFPESFPALNYVQGPDSGPLTAIVPHANALIFCSLNGLERFVWTNDPNQDGVKRTIPTTRGACTQEVVLNVEEVAYGLDRRGMWTFTGESPRAISRQIETLVQRINFAQESKFTAVWHPKIRQIRWWVALDADTEPHHFLAYDVDREVWSMGQRDFAVTAGALVPTTSGSKVLIGDENGYDWYDDEATTDGADGASPPQALVTGAPTTTSIPLLVTLPTSPSLAGTYAYSEELGESRLISANTSSTLTTAAFTTAPTVGTRIHLGRVNAEAKTKAFRAKNGMDVAGRSLRIHYEPLAVVAGAERRLRVRFYRDWSSTQVPQSAGPYAKPPNCTLDAATGDWLVDLTEPTGRATVPIGSGSASVVEIEIEITDSSVPVKILGLSVEGVDLEPVGTGHQ
jgi:hypothetical protein